MAQDRRIGRHTITCALHDARQSLPWVRHGIDVRGHTRLDVLQLRFSEICQHPPDASIDQRENLLSDMSIGTLGNHQAGYSRVERSVDTALVVVVPSIVDCRGPALSLGYKGIEREYTRLRLMKLCRALVCGSLGFREGGQ